MSSTGLSAFDTTVQATNVWLNEVLEGMGWREGDRAKAYHALRAVLHALRDQLPAEDGAKFGAQLPMLVRGIYYEGWQPGDLSAGRKQADFLAAIRKAFRDDVLVPEAIVRAVLAVLARHVSAGEIDHVKRALPDEIRQLWN